MTFYEWLNENHKEMIKDYDLLSKINDMFDLNVNHVNIRNSFSNGRKAKISNLG